MSMSESRAMHLRLLARFARRCLLEVLLAYNVIKTTTLVQFDTFN